MDVDFRTQAIHAGYEPLDNGRAAVPPIYASAAFDLGDAARGDALAGGDIDGFEYSRTHSEQLYTYAYDVYRFVLNADTMEITSRGRGRFRRG